MLKFEEYLQQFNNTVSVFDFTVGLLLTALLAMLVRIFYITYGDSISNRRRFANNFLPLALSTMLIITIVKSSIALSLGLVGALSIVRFRAAIKDPEELTYLFLVIGLGLSMGANQFVVGLIAIPAILLLLWLNKKFGGKTIFRTDGRMYVNIDTNLKDLKVITGSLTNVLDFVELKRMDTSDEGLSLSFIVKADSIDQIDQVRQDLSALSDQTKVSFIEQPDLVL